MRPLRCFVRRLAFYSTLAVVIALAGCTGLMSGLQHDVNADLANADRLLGKVAGGDTSEHDPDGLIVSDQLWLSGNTIKPTSLVVLPSTFREPASFNRTVGSLHEFAERIAVLTHIQVKVAPSAVPAAARAQDAGLAGAAGLPPLPPPSSAAGGKSYAPPAGGFQQGEPVAPVRIAYNGDLQGLLDAASSRFGVYWKFADGVIQFYYTDTRVFQVSAIPGDSRADASVVSTSTTDNSSGGGGGGNGGNAGGSSGASGTNGPSLSGANQTKIAMNAQLSVYNSLESSIRSMLSPAGAVVTSPATGSITVTDTPEVLERVSAFMEQQNRVLSRQILINVTVLSVTLSGEDNYGINWGAVYEALGTRFQIANTLATPTAVLNPTTFSASVITPSSRASGTTAMISALSQQGKVRRKTSASVATLNDQPVPVQVATQQSYLAQVSTTQTLNVGSQTSLTAGTFTTGFNLTLLPHILDSGTVMMQFYANISSLNSLQNVSSGGETIQVPNIDTRNFLQRIAMKSGETLVISGYEGTNDNGTQQGIGSPSNLLLGGSLDAQRSREVIVILITPVTMNGV